MTDVSLRANRLANEFEGMADAVRKSPNLDSTIYSYTAADDRSPSGEVTHTITCDQLSEAATLLRERGNGLTVSDEQMRELVVAVNGLRYGGLNAYSAQGASSVDDVIRWLKAFSDVLIGVAERAQAAERELQQLRVQRHSARAFLGLDVLDELVETVERTRVEQSGDLG